MTRSRAARAWLLLAVAAIALAVPSAAAAEPVFGEPSASAPLGEPIVVSGTISGVEEGSAVEVLLGMDGREQKIVVPAAETGNGDEWQASAEIDVPSSVGCTCFLEGPSAPNSPVQFQFRVRAPDGTLTFGPVGNVRVEDDRFAWQTLEDGLVRVHWYDTPQETVDGALDVANDAIDRAAELLGSTLPAPVDLFIYSTQAALLEAVSPQRENIAGEAHSDIQTMFIWIDPQDPPQEWSVTVGHELTHLVFNESTFNRYHEPPRWLNEGVATYLSEGYSNDFRGIVEVSALSGGLIPLQGLGGFFPSGDGFFLAYGESVSAVDFFVNQYSEETLWALVRSYAEGLSDDEAFTAATGSDLAAFNEAWMGSLDADVPDPLGPQPAPAGPIPSGWGAEGQPTPPASLVPSQTGDAGVTPAPGATPTTRPGEVPPPADGDGDAFPLAIILGIATLVGILIVVVLLARGRQNRNPPPPGFGPGTYPAQQWPPQPPPMQQWPPQQPPTQQWPPQQPPAQYPPAQYPPAQYPPVQPPPPTQPGQRPPSEPPGWD